MSFNKSGDYADGSNEKSEARVFYLNSRRGNIGTEMRVLATLFLFFLSGCQTLQKTQPVEFASDEEFRSWFAFYYRSPNPERLPMAIKFMDQKGYLEKHPDIAGAFISKVIERNPNMLPEWLAELNNNSAQTWNVILISVWMSNHPDFKNILATHGAKVGTENQSRLKSLVTKDPAPYDLKQITVFDPRQINMLWAAYSATGEKDYVNQIINNIDLYQPDADELESQIGETAIMTLATNSMQYDEVKYLCQLAEKEHPSPRTRILLEAMLGAVENIVAESKKELDRLPAH